MRKSLKLTKQFIENEAIMLKNHEVIQITGLEQLQQGGTYLKLHRAKKAGVQIVEDAKVNTPARDGGLSLGGRVYNAFYDLGSNRFESYFCGKNFLLTFFDEECKSGYVYRLA